MKLTDKAQKEITVLEEKIKELKETQEETYNTIKTTNNYIAEKTLRKECSKISNRIYNTEQKMETIKTEGIASSEKRKLGEEMKFFQTIENNHSLGMTHKTKIGFSKILNSNVIIYATYYSSFMHNVKGCSSLAGKISFDFDVITEEEKEAKIKEYEEKRKQAAN